MNKPSRRGELLAAAVEVVRERGASALTLDSVAEATGTSKGGVLYHFPTKESLVVAMIEAEIALFEAAIEAELARGRSAGEPSRGAFARAYVRASIADGMEPGLGGVLAAIANEERVLAAYREKTSQWRNLMASDGLDPTRAELIRLAADGLYYSLAIGAASPAGENRTALREALLGMTEAERV
jgi:AcrR family transcriptional regulator